MNDGPDNGPQPPVVLGPPQRPRGVRRLGNRPYWIGGAAGAAFVAVAGYAILSQRKGVDAEAPAAAAPPTQDAGAILAGLTGNGAVPAAGPRPQPTTPGPIAPERTQGTAPPSTGTPRGPAPATAPVDELRQAALRDAWTRHYQDYAALTTARREAAVNALRADTTYASGADAGGGQGQGQAGAVPGGVPGQQQQPRTPRPGELYQGPSRAADDYLQATVTPPLTKYELKAGDPIQIRFITGVKSDAPGQFVAIVTQPVFDHATGLHTLIPQGARVVGSYDHLQQVGTERLPAGATRIIFPGESSESLDLGSMPLADQAGYAGLHDKVDRHYGRLIFGTALLAIGGAGAQLTQPQRGSRDGYDAGQILAAQLGLQFGQVGSEFARQQLQARPTHTIRPGYTATLAVTQDVAFPGEWTEGVGMIPVAGRAR